MAKIVFHAISGRLSACLGLGFGIVGNFVAGIPGAKVAAMNTLTNSGCFKSIYTIPEAACAWAGVPLDQLNGAAYLSPCIPLIVGRPDVGERAQALMDACEYRTIKFTPAYASEDGPELIERRAIKKHDLLAWLKENFSGADAKLGGGPPPEAVQKKVPEELVKLLVLKDVLERVGISKATYYRLLEAKKFPAPEFQRPNRWKLSTINDYIEQNSK